MPSKADTLRAEAAENRRRAEESFDRCDTDGFLSQWANDMTAREKEQQAAIEDNGGVWPFLCLVDAETGDLVPAREIETRYGWKFAVFATIEDANAYNGEIVEWVSYGKVRRGTVPYRFAYQIRPAKATLSGSGTGLAGAASVRVITVPNDEVRLPADAPLVAAVFDEDGYPQCPEYDTV